MMFDEEWIKISISVEIIDIYDDHDDDRIISKKEWSDYGIIA